ncbi:MAG: deoxynucleoside kinase [Candidatus Babeliales bacterium]
MKTTYFPHKKLIILEGNMGAGKSTMLRLLKNIPDVSIIPEPTDKWQQVGAAGNLLDLFYKDTQRWAYTFQSYAFLTRVHAILQQQLESHDNHVHILERSIYCDRFCFAKSCYDLGTMSAIEWNVYREWFLWISENFVPRPQGFIYLRTTPEVAYQRITKRHRSEEVAVSMSYVQRLHERHEDWLIHAVDPLDSIRNVPILVLDCNQDFEHDTAQASRHLEAITSFIDNLDKKLDIPVKTGPQTGLINRDLTS